MKTFDEYRAILIDHVGDEDKDYEISAIKQFLSIPNLSNWSRVLEERVEEFDTMVYKYFNMTQDAIDNITYDDVLNVGTLSLISIDLHRIDEGETPLTEL